MAPMETTGRRIDWATPTVVQLNTEFIVRQISSDTFLCVRVGKKLNVARWHLAIINNNE